MNLRGKRIFIASGAGFIGTRWTDSIYKRFDADVRILHAPINIANQAFIMSRALRDSGYQSDLMVYNPNITYSNFGRHIDLEGLSRPKRWQKYLGVLLSSISEYDIFHFHFGNTLLPHYVDIPFIKAFGKKIVMQYWGSDVRRLSIASKMNKYAVVKFEDESRIIKNLKNHSRFVDAVVVSDHEIFEYVSPFFKRIEIIRPMLNLNSLRPTLGDARARPVIVHAPSHRTIKGTEFVLNAIQNLKSERYEFEFVLIEKIPNQEALRIYQEADIVIDQLRIGSYGLVSIEAMAMGKPVLCYIRDDLVDKYPPGLPILSTNPDNIYDNLKLLIENPELRVELGKRGREYVERVHDSRKIARQLIELYKSL